MPAEGVDNEASQPAENDLSKDFRFVTANSFVGIDASYRSALFCFYPIHGGSKDALAKCCRSLAKGGSTYPVAMHMVELVDFKIPEMKMSPGGNISTLKVEVGEWELADGPYLSIGAPIIHRPFGGTSWKEAREAIAKTFGLIVSAVGRGPIFEMAIELEVPAGEEFRQSIFTPAMRVPEALNFFALGDTMPVQEIARSLASASAGLRGRLEYGASVVGRAAQEKDETFRFLLYWMALEVIADGKEKKVVDHLASAYGKPFAAVREELEVRPCLQMRYEIVHLGKTPGLSARMERLLQAYFLDLTRFELGLPCQRIAGSLIEVVSVAEAIDAAENPV